MMVQRMIWNGIMLITMRIRICRQDECRKVGTVRLWWVETQDRPWYLFPTM